MVIPPTSHSLFQYFTGALHGEELDQIRQYFASSPALRGVEAGLRRAFEADLLAQRPDDHEAFARLLQRIEHEHALPSRALDRAIGGLGPAIHSPTGGSSHGAAELRPRLFGSGRVAPWRAHAVALYGSAALVVAASATVVVARHHRPATPPSNARHVKTVAGQLAFVILDDGTRVTLAPRSRLDAAAGFGSGHRTVTLDGEAYFNVASQTGAPFIVRTRQSDVRVLGTHFDVRAYATATTVAVLTGKVALTSRNAAAHRLVMTADHVGTVDAGGEVHLRQDEMAQYTGWMNGQLVFRNTPLSDVLERLSRWYGVPLSVEDPTLARETVFGDWQDKSLDTVLHLIADALGARVVQRGERTILVPR